jgi:hypothetical protein
MASRDRYGMCFACYGILSKQVQPLAMEERAAVAKQGWARQSWASISPLRVRCTFKISASGVCPKPLCVRSAVHRGDGCTGEEHAGHSKAMTV